ncbi:hypothetical protein GJ744_007206 [Endocarpon pusillum]|uniref:Uncharacterized protein n=1 Tax=Endocarpon pusillum TaxID=364733 RepID=A0A8H7DZ54_9EURO|nr:hypothetical protein GJ744_007206 [Endocarpon pusillum]
MPNSVQKSSWRRQFKSHDKVKKRLMTGAEASERDANQREKAAEKEARLNAVTSATQAEAEEEEAAEDPFLCPPSTAPAAIQTSRAGRKRAPTMKALEAEKAPKRGTGRGRGRGPG